MGARILVVDDDEMFRRSLTLVLDALGHAAVPVDSGARAVALAANERFDVMLLDQRMPRLSGAETWERIRVLPNAPRAILVTAAADGEALAARLGIAFLAKPFGVEELRAALARALERPPGGPA